MIRGERLTKKEIIDRAEKICALYATDKFTIDNCLEQCGIASERTWLNWQEKYTEVTELYKKAKQEKQATFDIRIKNKALTALEKRIEGYFVTETESTFGQDKEGELKQLSLKKKEKYIPPSDVLIQVTLYNKDAENFTNKQKHELTGKDGGAILYRLIEPKTNDDADGIS